MKINLDRTTDENRMIGEFLVRMPAIQRNSNIRMPNGDRVYDPGKAMSPEREQKVAQVIRSLSKRSR